MRNRGLIRGCVAGLAVVLLAGCSTSSPKSASSAPVSRATSSKSPVGAPSASPAKLAQLEKIVLQSADLPQGWKGAVHKAGPSDAVDQAALTKCVGARNTDSAKVAEANSADFGSGEATVSSSATSYRSQGDLDADIAMLHSPKLSPCFEQQMKKQFAATMPPGSTVESASVKITHGSAGGPANVLATGTGIVKVSVGGQPLPLYVSIAFITGPLIEAEVDSFNVGAPVPASVVKSLVAVVATRAAKG